MGWREQLYKFEYRKDWKSAINLMVDTVKSNPNDVEAYISIIYLLHNLLVEEDYPESEHEYISSLLKEYFDESNKKFYDNSEYLFFIGKILYIAEWYFGLDDGLKSVEATRAFKMQKRAYETDPGNALFEWAYRFSLGDDLAGYLAKKILIHDKKKIEWLKSKGFPGKYILESLNSSMKSYGG